MFKSYNFHAKENDPQNYYYFDGGFSSDELSKIENVSFSANLLKDVLTANKECESATLEISSKGLARIQFKVDDYDALYYLVADSND